MRSIIAVGSLVVLNGCCVQTKGWEEYCEAPPVDAPPADEPVGMAIGDLETPAFIVLINDKIENGERTGSVLTMLFNDGDIQVVSDGPCPELRPLHVTLAGARHA